MGQTLATRLSDYILPPRKGLLSAIAVTSTSAPYEMATYGQTAYASGANYEPHYWNFQADGNDVYIAFSTATLTVDNTAAGALAATICAKIPNGTTLQCMLNPASDIWFAIKTASGTATLRIWRSSP